MFKSTNYRIIETKEEFLIDWNERCGRYNYAMMPSSFNIDEASFPLALYFSESYDPHCCGSWSIEPLEEAKAIILKAYKDNIDYFTKKLEQLKNLRG